MICIISSIEIKQTKGTEMAFNKATDEIMEAAAKYIASNNNPNDDAIKAYIEAAMIADDNPTDTWVYRTTIEAKAALYF